MATQSPPTRNTAASDQKPQDPAPPPPPAAPVMVKPREEDNKESQNSREEAATEAFKSSISAGMEQPIREEHVQNAVKFLSHPKVRGSPVIYRRSFLEKKGLTREEIDEAFRRVPDPPSNTASVEDAKSTQGSTPRPATSLQPQPPTQNIQTAVVPSNVGPITHALQKPGFQWSQVLLGVGVIATFGAGTAVLFKTAVLPRLKGWIRKVAKEEDDDVKKDKLETILTKEAAEAAKTAASAAATVAKACQDLLSASSEEKKYFEAFMGLLDAQVNEMKSMRSSICNLEATREVTYPQETQIADIQSASENGRTNDTLMHPRVDQSDSRLSSINSHEQKMNGTVNGTVRPSTAPESVEPTATPYPKSFMEIMSMVQRGETPPGIKEINDMPPNPNQQLSNPRLMPRTKPWEFSQQVQQNPYSQTQRRVDGSIHEMKNDGQSSQLNGKALDGSDPQWKQKTTMTPETDHEMEESNLSSYGIGSKNWPGRDWVLPQTPSVAMPEAAAAIRKLPSVQKQEVAVAPTIQPSDREGDSARTTDPVIGAASSSGGAVDLSHENEIQEEQIDGVVAH